MSSMAARIPRRLRRPRTLSLAAQLLGLKRLFPSSAGVIKNGVLKWSYDFFQASPLSGVYKIEIEGKLGIRPSVWLSGGAIKQSNAIDAPHKYRVNNAMPKIEVCLDKGDWKSDQLYTNTYVFWAMEWIVHFEIWCATGEWTGGGIHSPGKKPDH